jgi:hypothetical protein
MCFRITDKEPTPTYKPQAEAIARLAFQSSVFRLRLHYEALTHYLQQDECLKQWYIHRCHQLTEIEHRRPPTGKQIGCYRRLSLDPVFSLEEQDDLLRQLPRLNFLTIVNSIQALSREIRFRNRI